MWLISLFVLLFQDWFDRSSQKNYKNTTQCLVQQYNKYFQRPLRIDSRSIMIEVSTTGSPRLIFRSELFSNIQPILRIQRRVIWQKNGNFCRLEEFLCFLKKNPCFWSKIKSMAKWPLSGLKWQIENAIWNFKKN